MEMAIVLEDDVRFEPYFMRELRALLKEAQDAQLGKVKYYGRHSLKLLDGRGGLIPKN